MFNNEQVHKKLALSASKGDVYETELLEQAPDTDAAKEFFTCLDLQLNKVNKFYKMKEKEFLDRGESLEKQMEILVEIKTAFNQKRGKSTTLQDSKEDVSISCTISCGIYSILFLSVNPKHKQLARKFILTVKSSMQGIHSLVCKVSLFCLFSLSKLKSDCNLSITFL